MVVAEHFFQVNSICLTTGKLEECDCEHQSFIVEKPLVHAFF